MEYEVEFFMDAIDDYKQAKENRDNDPDGHVGDGSVTWTALNRARNALHDRFRRAVLSVLGN